MGAYPAAYRSARAVDQAGRGFQSPKPFKPWSAGPWDRPSARRSPQSGGYWQQIPKMPMPANDNVRRAASFALRGIRIAARAHPLMRLIDLLDFLHSMTQTQHLGFGVSTSWVPDFICKSGFFAAGAGNFCPLPGQGEPSQIWNNCIVNGTKMGTWEFQGTIAGQKRYIFLGRYSWTGGTRCGIQNNARPRIVDAPAENRPEVPWFKPEEWAPIRPSPLPWKVIPQQKPEPNAPGPIRRETGPVPSPSPRPARQPAYDPFRYPQPTTPDIVINPRPVVVPPWWQPGSTPLPSPTRPGTRPTPVPTPGQGPVVIPVPPTVPGSVPVIRTEPGHLFRPPRPREKERKPKATGAIASAYNRIGKAWGHFTEATDAMNCVYGALPEKIRKREMAKRHGKNPSVTGKMKLIYQHADKINIASMLQCMAVEQVQDAAIGKASKAHADARKRYGIRGGYMSRLAKLPNINI